MSEQFQLAEQWLPFGNCIRWQRWRNEIKKKTICIIRFDESGMKRKYNLKNSKGTEFNQGAIGSGRDDSGRMNNSYMEFCETKCSIVVDAWSTCKI